MVNTDPCPCGSTHPYSSCCGRFLEQGAYPQQADALMRSRFTAYVQADTAYLIKTWHPKTCPTLNAEELKQTQWSRLEVLHHQSGLKKASVEFNAWYFTADGERCMHEISLFKKVKNRWVYVEPITAA